MFRKKKIYIRIVSRYFRFLRYGTGYRMDTVNSVWNVFKANLRHVMMFVSIAAIL